jgi:hypothetical protein
MTDEIVMAECYSSIIEAELFKGVLEAAGISAEVVRDDVGGLYPSLQSTSGVRLMVKKIDLERARELLAEADK